jgi:uncharacterized protein YegP (UPF0339 family)
MREGEELARGRYRMRSAAWLVATGLVYAMSAFTPAATADARDSAERIEHFQGKDDKHYFRMRARNREIILQSRGYKEGRDARRASDEARRAACDPNRFDIRRSRNDQYYFVLMGKDGKMLGRSEMYKSRSSVRRGIESVQKNAGCR